MSSALVLSDDNEQTAKSIVQQLKSQGVFDEFRRECLSDVDTKPSFMNLRQRTEGYVSRFLSQQQWSATLNKNQLRESLRRQINESGMVKFGVEHLAEQVITPKVKTSFYPRIDSLVKQLLGIQDEEVNEECAWPEDEEIDKVDDDSQMDIDESVPSIKIEVNVTENTELSRSDEITQNVGALESSFKIKTETTSIVDIEKSQSRIATVFKDSIEASDDVGPNKEAQRLIVQTSEKIKEKTKATEILKRKSNQQPQPVDETLLSDVSSVHTSDLSDFDDRISLSSDEDIQKEKVKLSLKKVKQMTSVASVFKDIQPSSTDDSDSNSKTLKKERISHVSTSNDNSNDKRTSTLNESTKSEDTKTTQRVQNSKTVSQIEEPLDENTESNQKPKKKLLKQRSETHNQQRYDASDLYKPRPVIASRRNRTSASDTGL